MNEVSHNSINSLIIRIASGDKEALESLYLEMKKPVYYYALRFCDNHDMAEDIMQDTFITVWSKSKSFVSKGNGRAWILTIAKNKSINALKKNTRDYPLSEIENNISNSTYFTEVFETGTVLGDLLSVLKKDEKDIVLLRHCIGFTLTEIAREKSMKKGTVFWSYNSAIKKLRKEYERMVRNEK